MALKQTGSCFGSEANLPVVETWLSGPTRMLSRHLIEVLKKFCMKVEGFRQRLYINCF